MLHKANAQETINCVIIKKNDKILAQEGEDCNIKYSPNSTFKIPLAVMGFESGILNTAHSPVWKPQKPVTFMKEFQEYIDKMQYGNRDLSGDENVSNGLTDSWFSFALKN